MEIICSSTNYYDPDPASCSVLCIRSAKGPAGVITVHISCSMYSISALGHILSLCVRVWWQILVAPCPFLPASLKRMSWWVRIGGRCCLVLGSPDGLSSRAQRARYILVKWTFKELWRPTSTTVKCTREKQIFCLYLARKGCRAVLNRSAAVSSNGERKHCWIIYSASVVGGFCDVGRKHWISLWLSPARCLTAEIISGFFFIEKGLLSIVHFSSSASQRDSSLFQM